MRLTGANLSKANADGESKMSDWVTNESPAYETETVVCRCPKCHEAVPLLVTLMAGSNIVHIEVGEEEK